MIAEQTDIDLLCPHTNLKNHRNLKIVKATLGSDVGVMGAAAVAWGLVW